MGLSTAKAVDEEPRPPGLRSSWSGRGTEGTVFIFPASFGIFVPVAAMSERSPPVCASEEDIFVCFGLIWWFECCSVREIFALHRVGRA